MATAVDTPLAESDLERYIELNALELLISSALGDVFHDHLRAIDALDDLRIGTDAESSMALYARLNPDEPADGDMAGQLAAARCDLLVARLLRSITPEVVAKEADYFERLAGSKLAALAAGQRGTADWTTYFDA